MIDLILSPEQISLISAAPDLLAACETGDESWSGPSFLSIAADIIDEELPSRHHLAIGLRAKAAAEQAAIAKARGRQRIQGDEA